ncbi:MAG TPA: hypothetical protein VME92_08505 [Acetobacteraceae bacterium]|nr:hypothetical protein [Acetobacteraceae bacterium]
MTAGPGRIRRRRMLAAIAAAVAGPRIGRAATGEIAGDEGTVPEAPGAELSERGATVLVAGPHDGDSAAWAALLAPELQRVLQPGRALTTEMVGANDGVTGANRFEAQVAPDGTTALLLPGEAAMAWLVGDPRARYDAADWVPALAVVGPAVLAGRVGIEALVPGRAIRIGAGSPGGPDLPALLALDLLGVQLVPIFGLADAEAARNALAQQAVDVVLLRDRNVPALVAQTVAVGGVPLFSMGAVDETGHIGRDPLFPTLPALPELLQRVRGSAALANSLYPPWQAAAAASQLDVGLVLQPLSPPGLVALWRRAAATAVAAAPVETAAKSLGLRPLPVPAATAAIAAIAPDAATLLELRRWLGGRFNWHPG